MKVIDRNGRLFGKISIIDVLVIAVVLVMGAALSFKSNQTHTGGNVSTAPISYQILVRGTYPFVGDAIQLGDDLFDPDRSTGGSLGKITDLEVLPGDKLTELNDGSLELVPVENGVNLLITVQGDGLIKDGRYLLNRIYDLGVNSSRNFCTRYAQFNGTVYAIL